MKNIIKLEARNYSFYKETMQREKILGGLGISEKGVFWMPPPAWCAEILGYGCPFKYKRKFLSKNIDYTLSNSKGSRGIFFVYIVESERLYEAKSHGDRYFFEIDSTTGKNKRVEDADTWIKSKKNI